MSLQPTDHELEQHLALIKDSSLRHTLQFGIGLHHAGLPDSDREVVERLYVEGKIQVRSACWFISYQLRCQVFWPVQSVWKWRVEGKIQVRSTCGFMD